VARRWMVGLVAVAIIAAACSKGGGSNEKVTLTLWHNYGTEQNATATKALVAAFEKAHPDIKINVVSQPADNYFSLLQASAVSKHGPDLATMWTGLFTLKYKNFLLNLKGKIPESDLARVHDIQWTADNFDASNGPFVVPLEIQFYIGFMNKQAFQKAGISKVPTTWSELFAACDKLKSAGFIPIVYGNGGQNLGAEFYPWYDMSYLMIGAHGLEQWKGLYDGQIPWTDPSNSAQLENWTKLHSSGCTNDDILTKTDNLGDFTTGKAAMMIDGTWDTQKFTDELGDNVAAFVPPFSDSPVQGVIEYGGDGFAATTYSKHQKEAVQFLQFLTTNDAAKIVNGAGLIPAIKGESTSNPVNQQMLDFVDKQGMTAYPMLDNVVQTDVVDTGNKVLPSVLAGKINPQDALSQLQQSWESLPADKRSTTYS
jgi:raffinose/stachyose/melibiose transport system substrate-binding protein